MFLYILLKQICKTPFIYFDHLLLLNMISMIIYNILIILIIVKLVSVCFISIFKNE